MPINIPSGAFRQGGDFFSLALPAIAQGISGMLAGKKELEATTYERETKAREQARTQALQNLSNLVQLHGADVVNLPEFNQLYQTIFGSAWPTEQVDIPAVTQKQPVPVTKTMPLQGRYGEVAAGPSEAERFLPGRPGMQMMPQKTVTGTEMQDVEVSPARTETRPRPLGGKVQEPTLGELGLPVPPGYARLTISQAKALGLDLDKMLFKDPITRQQVEGQLLADYAAGKTLTPQQQAMVKLLLSDQPKTLEAFIIQQIDRFGGYDKLPPPFKAYVDNWLNAQTKTDTVEQIMQKVAKTGIQSLNEGEFQIYMDKVAQRPERPPKETLEDLRVQYVRDPIFRAAVDANPTLRALLFGVVGTAGELDKVTLRQMQLKATEAQAAFYTALGAWQAINTQKLAAGVRDPAKLMKDPLYAEAYGKMEAARKIAELWRARLKEMQDASQQPPGGGTVMQQRPDANTVPAGALWYEDDGSVWRSDGKNWLRVK